MKGAVQQKHGTTIVIVENAVEEAKRLSSSSFKIFPFDCMKVIKHITSIDGAAMLWKCGWTYDPMGRKMLEVL